MRKARVSLAGKVFLLVCAHGYVWGSECACLYVCMYTYMCMYVLMCAHADAMVRQCLVYVFGCVRSAGSESVCGFGCCSVGPMSDVEGEATP